MKKTLLMAAGLAATFVAAPALAAPAGVVDLSYSNLDVGSTDIDAINVGGSVVTPLSDALQVQFDAGFSRNSFNSGEYTVGAGAVHVYHRAQNFAVGGVLGVSDGVGVGIYSLGVEGKAYLGPVSLNGSASAVTIDNINESGWTVNAGGKFFALPNLSLGANVGYTDLDVVETTTYGVGAEYKFGTSPVSVFGDYTRTDIDNASVDVDAFTLGVRYQFGQGTLKDRDATGPIMTRGAAGLPIFLF